VLAGAGGGADEAVAVVDEGGDATTVVELVVVADEEDESRNEGESAVFAVAFSGGGNFHDWEFDSETEEVPGRLMVVDTDMSIERAVVS